MSTILSNAFSLSMVPNLNNIGNEFTIRTRVVGVEEVKSLLANGFNSCVGHEDACAKYSELLAIPISYNRTSVKIDVGDKLIVGQFTGQRLVEGATTISAPSYSWLVIELLV